MRLLCLADLHLTDKRPRNRIDNYSDTQYSKFEHILDISTNEYEIDCILVAGDLFDSYNCSNDLLQKYIKLLKKYNTMMYVTPGQHDLKYHSSNINQSPLSVLQAAEVAVVITKLRWRQLCDTVNLYGAGWNETIPEWPFDHNRINILITHRMVINNEKLWHDQESFTWGHRFLRNNCFDLIVSGDNHQSFTIKLSDGDKKVLVNPGSMCRSTSAQLDHNPSFFIYDTETLKILRETIPIHTAADVFCIDKINEKKTQDEETNAFVEKLSGTAEITGLDFKVNVIEYLKNNKIKKTIKGIINDVMEVN